MSSKFSILVSFILMLSPLLVGSSIEIVSIVGKLNIYFYSLFLIFFAALRPVKIKIDYVLILVFIFMFYMVFRSVTYSGLIMSMQFFVLGLIFILYRVRTLPLLTINARCLYILILFFSLFEILSPSGWFMNSNYWSIMIMLYTLPLLFVIDNVVFKKLILILSVFFILLSGSRAVLLSAIFSYFIVYNIMKDKFGIVKFIKYIVFSFLIVFVINFSIDILNDINFYNDLFLDYTGKRLESGRFDIWLALFDSLSFSEWIFGKGGGVTVEDILNIKLSAHSTYVYLIFTYGFVGIILFLLVYFSILLKLNDEKYYISIYFSLALIIRDFFEVSLVHNNYPIAFFFWALFLTSSFEKSLRENYASNITRHG